jgi:acyl carrier protein
MGDDRAELKRALKALIVEAANLQNVEPGSIADDGALFGQGLGLDSLDALQLAMSIEERFGVRMPEGEEGRTAFASVNALAEHVAAHRKAS